MICVEILFWKKIYRNADEKKKCMSPFKAEQLVN